MAMLVIVVACIALAWVQRAALLKWGVSKYCAERDLVCELTPEKIGLSHVTLTDVSANAASKDDVLKIDRLELGLSWSGLKTPSVTRVNIDEASLAAQYDGQSLSFYGLEALASGEDSNAPLPDLILTNGRFDVDTPAGMLHGTAALENRTGRRRLEVQVEPARLQNGSNRLDLISAEIFVNLDNQKDDAAVSVNVQNLVLGGQEIDQFEARLETLTPGSDHLSWTFGASGFASDAGLLAESLSGSGELRLSETFTADAPPSISAIDALNGTIEAVGIQALTAQAGVAALEFSADRLSTQKIQIELNGAAQSASYQGHAAKDIKVVFNSGFNTSANELTGSGRVSLAGAALSNAARQSAQSLINIGEPLTSHARQLRSVIDRAASDFDAQLAFRLDGKPGQDLQLSSSEAINLTAASGLTAMIEPHNAQPTLLISERGASVAGLFDLRGGGGPSVSIDIKTLETSPAGTQIDIGGLTLAPWAVDSRTLSAALNRLYLESEPGEIHAETLGEIQYTGDVFGIDIAGSRLFGGIQAARQTGIWRAQTLDTDCLGLELDGAQFAGDLRLQPVDLKLCPEGGRFVATQSGHPEGVLRLGEVELPFEGRDVSGRLGLQNALVNWQGGTGFAITLGAERLTLPMQVGRKTLAFDSQAPSLSFSSEDRTLISAVLTQTDISGSMVPANVFAPRLDFDAGLTDLGLSGVIKSPGVRITDLNTDAIYQPLIADLDAQLNETFLSLAGPIRLEGRAETVANTQLSLDLIMLNGTGSVTTDFLTFEQSGLQPKHLSDRLRGIASNARGSVRARSDLNIASGQLSASGNLSVSELGFDTLRVGSIDGVNGELVFTDLLTLTTAPRQVVTIDRIEPGVPLTGGEIIFQLKNARSAYLEKAEWPFAGGLLSLVPVEWTVGGDQDRVVVSADQIELSELVEVLTLPDMQAEGTVSGQFPIELSGGNVFIRDARLKADNDGGVLRYTGEVAQQAANTDPFVAYAFDALRDFQYDVLELGVDGNLIGDIVLSLKLLGRSPDVLGGAEFDFNISIESKLAQLVRSGQSALTTDWLVDAIKSQSEDALDPS